MDGFFILIFLMVAVGVGISPVFVRFVVTGGISGVTYSAGEIGDVDQDIVEVTFTANVNSPGADYAAGVTIKVNAVSVTISTSARQDPTNNLVHYDLLSDVDINDTVTWEYDDDFGDLEDDGGLPLGDILAQAVTNYVGSHFYFDTEWSSGWIAP